MEKTKKVKVTKAEFWLENDIHVVWIKNVESGWEVISYKNNEHHKHYAVSLLQPTLKNAKYFASKR